MKVQPWYCNTKKASSVIDRIASNPRLHPDDRKEAICTTTVKIWDKYDRYCTQGVR